MFIQHLGIPEEQEDGRYRFVNEMVPGERWATENIPDPAYTLLGQALPGQVSWQTEIRYLWLPVARHFTPDGPREGEIVQDVTQIPKGAWSMTMTQYTGQTWTVWNELSWYPAADGSDWDPSTQIDWLDVQ